VAAGTAGGTESGCVSVRSTIGSAALGEDLLFAACAAPQCSHGSPRQPLQPR
jgi:hypothetical protein